jgi:hypothetical protein
MDTPQQKKSHKGGSVVRTEPSDMHLFDVEPLIREVFQRVGCLNFCQNMQRGHPEVAREFSLNFDGTKTKWEPLNWKYLRPPLQQPLRYPTLVKGGSNL